MNSTRPPISAGLHFVATPIGNARDITLRTLDLLAGADMLVAEDTRTLRKLMDIHGIALGERPLIAYHDHSAPRVRDRLVEAVAAGRSVVYASEAGTPLLADPGYALGRAMIAADLPLRAAPGASALLAALAVSGLPTDRFAFLGFLPPGEIQREAALAELHGCAFTMCFYESPRRLGEMLASASRILGPDRPAVVARELTKRFEEVARDSLGALAERFAAEGVRGEVVVLIGAGTGARTGAEDLEGALRNALATMRIKDAATAVAGALGLPRREVYQAALRLAGDTEE